ncbi:MAG: ATP-binding protein [Deltaproteobacteria bacterium]|nr:ATP-binding protein [Deltaproteobacteria bacterium]
MTPPLTPDPEYFAAVLAEKLADVAARPLPILTPRVVTGPVQFRGKATAVTGIRRSGKTWFLHQLRAERVRRGTPLAHLPYVNFEDERLVGLRAEHLSRLLEGFYLNFPELRRGATPVLWCLDEIQSVPGWERFVRRLLDDEAVEVVVTGSSAALLSREVATALRGRAWPVVLFPFSFAEALRHAGRTPPARPESLASRDRSALERALRDYLEAGGFPEAQGLEQPARFRLLHDYVDVAILRDVVERHAVSNVTGLRWLVRHLLGNAAGVFSVEKFHAALRSQGIAISRDTVHELLAFVQDCYLVRTVWMESASERRRMVNPRKTYPVDPGLIAAFDRSGRANLGHALETTVLIELERRGVETTYVRTAEGHEVDFLARHADGRTELIQVCADASGGDTASRELRALTEARRQFPKARATLLTASRAGLPPSVPSGVKAEPAWVWLLRPPS